MRIFRLVIECRTPLHCGGPNTDPVLDQPVARDAFGYWRIPATSLAGALRALATSLNPQMADRLFGKIGASHDETIPSKIWCEDGRLLDFDGQTCVSRKLAGKKPGIEPLSVVRDHVKLDLDTGTGVDGGKFDAELVPAGVRFLLEFRCDGWDKPLEEEAVEFFDRLCAEVLAGRLDLGGGLSRGYGRYNVLDFSLSDVDLSTQQGQEAWLNLPDGLSLPGQKITPPAAAALPRGNGLTGTMEIPLETMGPILIAGGSPVLPNGEISDADLVFNRVPYADYAQKGFIWKFALPSSSLKGVLRHAIYDIAIARGLDKKQAKAALDAIFGQVSGKKATAAKIGIEDCELETGRVQLVQHVALDRMSGGALDGALFNEEPLWKSNGKFRLRLKLDGLEDWQAALLFHALLDLFSGSLAAGSGVNRGNGRIHFPDWQNRLNAIKGDLAWQGAPLLPLSPDCLAAAAKDWDAALNKFAADCKAAQGAANA